MDVAVVERPCMGASVGAAMGASRALPLVEAEPVESHRGCVGVQMPSTVDAHGAAGPMRYASHI